MPAHVATFCAVSAQLTFLPLLVALQATFFLEWRARQATLSEATVAAFLHASAPFIQQLRTFLSAHESSDKPRFGVL